MFKVIRSMNTQ